MTAHPLLDDAIRTLISDNPDKAAQVRENPKQIGWFVGRIMKVVGGTIHPAFVLEMVETALRSNSAPGSVEPTRTGGASPA